MYQVSQLLKAALSALKAVKRIEVTLGNQAHLMSIYCLPMLSDIRDINEAEEIWIIRNFVLWVTEYCILPYNISSSVVMAMAWAGSQVTKLIRAAGALALGPFVEQGLSWFVEKYQFESRQKAFLAVVASCVGLAVETGRLVNTSLKRAGP